MKRKQLAIWLAVLLVTMPMLSCQDKTATQVADYLVTAAKVNDQLFKATNDYFVEGVITVDEARPIVMFCHQFAASGITATESIKKLDPNAKVRLYAMVHPLVQSLNPAAMAELMHIKNERARGDLSLILTSLQTALFAADGLLAGGN